MLTWVDLNFCDNVTISQVYFCMMYFRKSVELVPKVRVNETGMRRRKKGDVHKEIVPIYTMSCFEAIECNQLHSRWIASNESCDYVLVF